MDFNVTRHLTIIYSNGIVFFPYLKVAVLVDVSTGEATDFSHGGNITVGVGEEKQVHTAPGRHTLLA